MKLWYDCHNMAKKKSKIIQVPMPEDLLGKLDALADEREEPRSLVIRDAVATYITKCRDEEADRQYIQSYREMPETEEDLAWAKLGEQMLAELYGDEDWSEEYERFIREQDAKG